MDPRSSPFKEELNFGSCAKKKAKNNGPVTSIACDLPAADLFLLLTYLVIFFIMSLYGGFHLDRSK